MNLARSGWLALLPLIVVGVWLATPASPVAARSAPSLCQQARGVSAATCTAATQDAVSHGAKNVRAVVDGGCIEQECGGCPPNCVVACPPVCVGGCPPICDGGPNPAQTPELDSFTLFLIGAVGLGGFGLLQWRKAKRRAEPVSSLL
jgi:hypothetical protein